nr:hypothetical protein [Sedimentibacter sp.]
MKNNIYKKFRYKIITLITLLFMLTATSCAANNTDVADNPKQELDNLQKPEEIEKEPEESENNLEEPSGIIVDGELRYYDGELVNTAKQLIKNSLALNDVEIGIGFSTDLEDNIVDENSVTYCKVYDNEYGFKSTKDIDQFLADTYSNKDTIYKIIHSGDIPVYKDFDGQLYAYNGIHASSRPYIITDWFNIYITDITENTAVINYPLYDFRYGVDDAVKTYKNTISKVNGVWLLDGILEAELIELDETSKKTLGIRSITLERMDGLQLTKFIGIEGESIELDGIKYTNIGRLSDSGQFESYTNENLSAYCQNYTSNIYNVLMPYFKEIDGKLYVRNIGDIRKEYTRLYKPETLEVLNVSDTEASLEIKYLDGNNQEKTLQFKMYPDTVIYWRWLPDTIL